SSDLLAQPVDHTSSCFSFFWGTLSPQGEGENTKKRQPCCRFCFTSISLIFHPEKGTFSP
ncbi:hypothetical protein, partial [Enterobacter cloacae]|uniref:hypothetical protein n=1 Tax=Enterobacter cloacae TaxID=550 RepID=UPI001D082AE3